MATLRGEVGGVGKEGNDPILMVNTSSYNHISALMDTQSRSNHSRDKEGGVGTH